MNCPKNVAELDLLASEPSPEVVGAVGAIPGDIVVAGAGGKMGYHLCRMLKRAVEASDSDSRIIAVSRFGGTGSREPFEAAGIAVHPADLCQAGEVESLPDASVLFFLAGKKFGTSDDPDELRRFNEGMPGLVAERYRDSRIIALSTGCVYPFVTPDSGGSREEDPVGPVGEYAISCLGRERVFREASGRHGTALALIRLNYSVDLRYGVLVDLAARILNDEPIDLTTGFFNCIWQGDAVAAIIRSSAITRPEPDPLILNVTGPLTLSVREVAGKIAEGLGRKVRFTGSESGTAWLNHAALSHRLFGRPRISEHTLIDWVVEWVGAGRPLLGKPTRFEVRDGNF